MKTLYEEIGRHCGKNAPCIIKHMKAAGVGAWEDLNRASMFALKDEIKGTVAPNSAKTYLAQIRAVLARFSDEVTMPKGWEAIFRQKAEKAVKTFLTVKEIEDFAEVETKGELERYVHACFLVGCWTGCRVSDIQNLTEENIKGGTLSYVSEKTGILSVIPAKPGLWEYIKIVQEHEGEVCLMTYNRIVRRLAKRAGICETVKIHKAGKTRIVEKWEALSSHSARISVATNLSIMGVPMNDLKSVLGHTSVSMSERYVVQTRANLSACAMRYFA